MKNLNSHANRETGTLIKADTRTQTYIKHTSQTFTEHRQGYERTQTSTNAATETDTGTNKPINIVEIQPTCMNHCMSSQIQVKWPSSTCRCKREQYGKHTHTLSLLNERIVVATISFTRMYKNSNKIIQILGLGQWRVKFRLCFLGNVLQRNKNKTNVSFQMCWRELWGE